MSLHLRISSIPNSLYTVEFMVCFSFKEQVASCPVAVTYLYPFANFIHLNKGKNLASPILVLIGLEESYKKLLAFATVGYDLFFKLTLKGSLATKH